jgi:hypothetical protein
VRNGQTKIKKQTNKQKNTKSETPGSGTIVEFQS